MLGIAVLFLGALTTRAQACQFDDNCELGQFCSAGICVTPHAARSCTQNLDCGLDETCNASHCVPADSEPPALTPAAPPLLSELRTRFVHPPADPDTSAAAPQAEPAPPQEDTPPAAQPPPEEPSSPPGVPASPPGDGQKPAAQQFHPHVTFDLFAGGSFAFFQTAVSSAFASGFEGAVQLGYQVTPNLELALRGGGSWGSAAQGSFSTVSGEAGLMFPHVHTGLFCGLLNAPSPDGGRETGFQVVVPYDVPLTSFLTFGTDVSFGFLPNVETTTVDVYLGF